MPASPAPAAVRTDWQRVAALLQPRGRWMRSRRRGSLPERKVLYQFSARGHDLAQILLGLQLTDPHDGVGVYYRSRPLMLALGSTLEDAAAGPLARAGSFSDGRDIGVVFNMPEPRRPDRAAGLCGGVGAQYTPAAGWAQAIRYHREMLQDAAYARQHRGGAGRRCLHRHQRVLVRADHRHDAAAADAVLHRGQRLRHLGALGAADAGRQHRRESRLVRRAHHPGRRRHRPARSRGADPRGRRARARRSARRCCCGSRCRACRAIPGRTRRPTSPRRSWRWSARAIR